MADYLQLYQEPPSNLTTLIIGFGGWLDAGEAATGAIRYMVRRLAATRLASIDSEEFFDFTLVRPFVRTQPDGSRTVRWPGNEFFMWKQPSVETGLLLFRGTEPSLKWRTFCNLVLDLAEQCGVQRIVSLGALLAALPHTRPPRINGNTTDPKWRPLLEEWSILRQRRPGYQGPTGVSTALYDAAAQRGIPYLSFTGQAPHYIQAAPNPVVTCALVSYACRLLGITIDLSRLEETSNAFRTRCDQIVSQEPAMQSYVRQLEEQYDANATPRGLPDVADDDWSPEEMFHELEDFLRRYREDDSGA